MIINIIIIGYIALMILSSLLQIILIGKPSKPTTAGGVIGNIIITATFLIALFIKLNG